ncbi:MAG: alpha/beta hydrolase [Actinomycetota bacterium]|nr:alpha/beta hydrolase [Actinomycetota bacterium]
MSTFALVPGAGGVAWYFSRLDPLLEQADHEAIAIDLPGDDDSAGLSEYANIIQTAIGERRDVVLVAQSLGGFPAAVVAQRAALKAIVFLNAMIPNPGEAAAAWWGNTDSAAARTEAAKRNGYSPEFDLETYFLHDVDPGVAAEGEPYQRNETDTVFDEACEFATWPDVPIHVVAGADDRFFPVEFQQRVARERLGVKATVLPGGHLMALSQPKALADYLVSL